MNWYIGQEILCVKSHSQNAVKKNNIYIIKGTRLGCCNNIELDIGISTNIALQECADCGKISKSGGIWWIYAELFVPLEYNAKAIEELQKEPKKYTIHELLGIDKP